MEKTRWNESSFSWICMLIENYCEDTWLFSWLMMEVIFNSNKHKAINKWNKRDRRMQWVSACESLKTKDILFPRDNVNTYDYIINRLIFQQGASPQWSLTTRALWSNVSLPNDPQSLFQIPILIKYTFLKEFFFSKGGWIVPNFTRNSWLNCF